MVAEVERHRAAMFRVGLSRPVRLAFEAGLVAPATTIFDYGCGRGSDVDLLKNEGFDVVGWDPYFAADVPKHAADVVNLGYVINVIEDPSEREAALKSAWSLAKQVLVVAARLANESRSVSGEHFADGVITKRGTFQKFFEQAELKEYIERVTGASPVPAAPGIYFVFRDDTAKQSFLMSRYRRLHTVSRPRLKEEWFERHRASLEPVLQLYEARGRMPTIEEYPGIVEISKRIGSLSRITKAIEEVIGLEHLSELRTALKEDLLVYLALAKFEKRPSLKQLPSGLQADIHSLFASYKDACEEADQLLFSVGQPQTIARACRASKVGKLTPEALYVHRSAIQALSPVLRVFEGCARVLVGDVEGATLVKLSIAEPKVSYLTYPKFDEDPHPSLAECLRVHLQTFDLKYRFFQDAANPPILHRKETFVAPDYSLREKFARLTAQEERFGLYEEAHRIGTRNGWEAALQAKGVTLNGHRVVKRKCSSQG